MGGYPSIPPRTEAAQLGCLWQQVEQRRLNTLTNKKQYCHEEAELSEKLNGESSKLRAESQFIELCDLVFRKIQVQGKDSKR